MTKLITTWLGCTCLMVLSVGCGGNQSRPVFYSDVKSSSCRVDETWDVPLNYQHANSPVATLQALFGLTAITGDSMAEILKSKNAIKYSIPCDKVPQSAKPLVREASQQSHVGKVLGLMKPQLFASGLYRQLRHKHHQEIIIDDKRSSFMRRYGLIAEKYKHLDAGLGGYFGHWHWPEEYQVQVLSPSLVKGKVRILVRSDRSPFPSFSIALTLDSASYPEQSAEAETLPVLETELIVQRDRDRQNWDFYAYGADGRAADRTSFQSSRGASVQAAVPHVCMGCHLDSKAKRFGRDPHSFAGHDSWIYRIF